MNTRRIGSLDVSTVGLGCNNFGWHIDEPASREVIFAALDAGITHFDTAAAYGDGESERILGRALGDRRSEITIATKFGNRVPVDPNAVKQQCEESLRRLGIDTIDLYYLHKPNADTPIADTLGALDDLVQAGKVREIACSNLSPEQLREADEAAGDGARFVALQNEYNLLHREPEDGTLDACRDLGLAFVPFFPLKSGLLTGKYRKGDAVPQGSRLSGKEDSYFTDYRDKLLTEDNLDLVERLIDFAGARDHTILDLAFSWLLAHDPVASVIAGATKPAQIRANVEAADWHLTDDDLAEVDRITAQPA
jgi:aryl-alcohol dehydrogenase-like predicted oxidoreductase